MCIQSVSVCSGWGSSPCFCLRCRNGTLHSLPAAFPQRGSANTWALPDAAVGAGAHLYLKPPVDDLMPPVWKCDSASDGGIRFVIGSCCSSSLGIKNFCRVHHLNAPISINVCVCTCLQLPIKHNYSRAIIVLCVRVRVRVAHIVTSQSESCWGLTAFSCCNSPHRLTWGSEDANSAFYRLLKWHFENRVPSHLSSCPTFSAPPTPTAVRSTGACSCRCWKILPILLHAR